MSAIKTAKVLHMLKWLLRDFIAAWLVGAMLGSIVQTQMNLHQLGKFGLAIDFEGRLRSSAFDLISFAPNYGALLLVALLIAFGVDALVSKLRNQSSIVRTALAGASAVLMMLWLMRVALGLQPISAARDATGMMAFALSGAAAGWLFAWLRMRTARSERALES